MKSSSIDFHLTVKVELLFRFSLQFKKLILIVHQLIVDLRQEFTEFLKLNPMNHDQFEKYICQLLLLKL